MFVLLLLMLGLIAFGQVAVQPTFSKVYPKQQKMLLLFNGSPGSQTHTPTSNPNKYRYIMFAPAVYSYRQGKLPLFCALEDRIWRSTGIGMQFRLIDRPYGFR